METVTAPAGVDPRSCRAASHEAGHALVAVDLGIPFGRVTLGEAAGSAGRLRGIRYPDESRLNHGQVEDFLTYLAAGAAAVELLHGPDVISGSSEDRLQAEFWAARAFPHPAEYASRLARAQERARTLLRRRRAALAALVTTLLRTGELTQAQVRQVLQESGTSPGA